MLQQLDTRMHLRETLNAPAALNARPPGESVIGHFLQADHALSFLRAHLPRGTGHQLPEVDGVVVEQRQQAALMGEESTLFWNLLTFKDDTNIHKVYTTGFRLHNTQEEGSPVQAGSGSA